MEHPQVTRKHRRVASTLAEIKLPVPPPKELTAIPVTKSEGSIGAMAFFAVLAHPGTSASDHLKRDRVMQAIQCWVSTWKKYQLGFTRTSKRRASIAKARGINPHPPLKNEAVLRILNRTQRVLVEHRLLAAAIAEQLAGVHAGRHFEGSQLRLTISGPQSLTSAIEFASHNVLYRDPSVLWRIWRESLPVLHLASAFHFCQPKRNENDRPDLIIRCVRDHHLWLAETLRSAEARALQLQLFTNFDPRNRISLAAE